MPGAIVPDDWDGITFDCLQIQWPSSEKWRAILLGQMSEPSFEHYWDDGFGDPSEAASAAGAAYRQTVEDELSVCAKNIVGEVSLYAGLSTPEGWLVCSGQAISRVDYSDLFTAIGETYGSGDGMTTFNVPNFQARFPIGSNLQLPPGATGGEIEHTLTIDEMPSHNHSRNPSGDTEFYLHGSGSNLGFSTVFVRQSGSASTTGNKGSGQPHNNMPPYLSMRFIIYAGS